MACGGPTACSDLMTGAGPYGMWQGGPYGLRCLRILRRPMTSGGHMRRRNRKTCGGATACSNPNRLLRSVLTGCSRPAAFGDPMDRSRNR